MKSKKRATASVDEKPDSDKDREKKQGGLFGRLFGRRRKSEESQADAPEEREKSVSENGAATSTSIKEESTEDVSISDGAEVKPSEVAIEPAVSPVPGAVVQAEVKAAPPSEKTGPAKSNPVLKAVSAASASESDDGALPSPEPADTEPSPEGELEVAKVKAGDGDSVPDAFVVVENGGGSRESTEAVADSSQPASHEAPDAPAAETSLTPLEGSSADEKQGFFSRLKQGLAKTRKQFVGTLDNLLYGDKEIDEEFLEELEEILLTSDLGVKTSYRLFSQVEEKVSHKELENPAHLRRFLQSEIGAILKQAEAPWEITPKPYVIMTIGVNGVGKTTTIGKLAAIFAKQKKKVVLGAADTFRAAAVEQLEVWANRAKVPIVRQKMGADPAAVAFDTVQSALKREADVVIIDTAGRLHTKVNLMDELKKIQRVLDKALPGAPHEVLLVLDANTGQNAINQAQMFNQAIGVTGLVMTKLDGTAKGGVIVGVCDELKVPVRYIGIGESLRDLRPFSAEDFVDALFDRS